MLRVKGLECLVSILKCMVEWSRDYYIDPATTGLNTVRVIRTEKGNAPEQLGLNEAEGEEREAEEKAQSRHSSLTTGRPGTGTGAEGGHLYIYIHVHVYTCTAIAYRVFHFISMNTFLPFSLLPSLPSPSGDEMRYDSPEQFESKKQLKLTMQQGIRL